MEPGTKNKRCKPCFVLCLLAFLLCLSCVGRQFVEEISIEATTQPESYFKEPQRITTGLEANFAASLSPNGAYLLYTSTRRGNKDIWIKKIRGGYPRWMTRHSADDFSPVMSPDGRKMAFISRRDDALGDVYIMDVGSSIFRQVLNQEGDSDRIALPKTEELDVAWFPDSKRVVFASRRMSDHDFYLYVAQVNDDYIDPLNNLRGRQPAVSQDGQRIAYVHKGAIFLYDLEQKRTWQLTTGKDFIDAQPRFVNDDQNLVFLRIADDTNDDGQLNLEDHATIWIMELKYQLNKKNPRDNFILQPLTSARFAAYQPSMRAESLFFTQKRFNTLDVYQIHKAGHYSGDWHKDSIARMRDMVTHPDDEIFLLRWAASQAYKNQDLELSLYYAIENLKLFLLTGKDHQVSALAEQIKINFARQHPAALILVDLLAREARLRTYLQAPMNHHLNVQETKQLKRAMHAIDAQVNQLNQLEKDGQAFTKQAHERALFLKAKIKAALGHLADAQKLLDELIENNTSNIAAAAAIYKAELSLAMAGEQVYRAMLLQLGARFADQKHTARLILSKLITGSSDVEKKVDFLQQVMQQVPESYLKDLMRWELAKSYIEISRSTLALHELRRLTDSHTTASDLQINALELFVEQLNKEGRLDQSLQYVRRFLQKEQSYSAIQRHKLKSIVVSLLMSQGEDALKRGDNQKARASFYEVEKWDPDHMGAAIGLINLQLKNLSLEKLIDEYAVKVEQSDRYRDQFIYAYLLYQSLHTPIKESLRQKRFETCMKIIDEMRDKNIENASLLQMAGDLYLYQAQVIEQENQSSSFQARYRRTARFLKAYFGFAEPDFFEMALDAYFTAYNLSSDESLDRAQQAERIAEAFWGIGNYGQALRFYFERIYSYELYPESNVIKKAYIYRQAARAAFYSDDYDISASLWGRLATIWQQLNKKEQQAEALDYQALVLRQQEKWQEAINVYEQLIELQKQLAQEDNLTQSYVNLAWCLLQNKEFAKAIRWAQTAEKRIVPEAKIASTSRSTDLQVSLGDASVAAAGFDGLTKLIMLADIQLRSYRHLGFWQQALNAVNKKLHWIEQKRSTLSFSPQAARDFKMAQAITLNTRGILRYQMEQFLEAFESFRQADELTQELYNQDNDQVAVEQLIVLINGALALKNIALEQRVQIKDVAEFWDHLVDILKHSYQAYKRGEVSYASYLAELYLLSAQVLHKGVVKRDQSLVQKHIKRAKQIIYRQGLTKQLGESLVMSQPLRPIEKLDHIDRSILRFVRQQGLSNPRGEWRIYAYFGYAKLAYESLVKNEVVLSTPAQRQVAHLILDEVFQEQKNSHQDQLKVLLNWHAARIMSLASDFYDKDEIAQLRQTLQQFTLAHVQEFIGPQDLVSIGYLDSKRQLHVFYLTSQGLLPGSPATPIRGLKEWRQQLEQIITDGSQFKNIYLCPISVDMLGPWVSELIIPLRRKVPISLMAHPAFIKEMKNNFDLKNNKIILAHKLSEKITSKNSLVEMSVLSDDDWTHLTQQDLVIKGDLLVSFRHLVVKSRKLIASYLTKSHVSNAMGHVSGGLIQAIRKNRIQVHTVILPHTAQKEFLTTDKLLAMFVIMRAVHAARVVFVKNIKSLIIEGDYLTGDDYSHLEPMVIGYPGIARAQVYHYAQKRLIELIAQLNQHTSLDDQDARFKAALFYADISSKEKDYTEMAHKLIEVLFKKRSYDQALRLHEEIMRRRMMQKDFNTLDQDLRFGFVLALAAKNKDRALYYLNHWAQLQDHANNDELSIRHLEFLSVFGDPQKALLEIEQALSAKLQNSQDEVKNQNQIEMLLSLKARLLCDVIGDWSQCLQMARDLKRENAFSLYGLKTLQQFFLDRFIARDRYVQAIEWLKSEQMPEVEDSVEMMTLRQRIFEHIRHGHFEAADKLYQAQIEAITRPADKEQWINWYVNLLFRAGYFVSEINRKPFLSIIHNHCGYKWLSFAGSSDQPRPGFELKMEDVRFKNNLTDHKNKYCYLQDQVHNKKLSAEDLRLAAQEAQQAGYDDISHRLLYEGYRRARQAQQSDVALKIINEWFMNMVYSENRERIMGVAGDLRSEFITINDVVDDVIEFLQDKKMFEHALTLFLTFKVQLKGIDNKLRPQGSMDGYGHFLINLIKTKLMPKEALVIYVTSKKYNKPLVSLITRQGVQYEAPNISQDEFKKWLSFYKELLIRHSAMDDVEKRLSNVLLPRSLSNLSENIDQLYVLKPHYLDEIRFASLPWEGQPLGEKFRLVLLSSYLTLTQDVPTETQMEPLRGQAQVLYQSWVNESGYFAKAAQRFKFYLPVMTKTTPQDRNSQHDVLVIYVQEQQASRKQDAGSNQVTCALYIHDFDTIPDPKGLPCEPTYSLAIHHRDNLTKGLILKAYLKEFAKSRDVFGAYQKTQEQLRQQFRHPGDWTAFEIFAHRIGHR